MWRRYEQAPPAIIIVNNITVVVGSLPLNAVAFSAKAFGYQLQEHTKRALRKCYFLSASRLHGINSLHLIPSRSSGDENILHLSHGDHAAGLMAQKAPLKRASTFKFEDLNERNVYMQPAAAIENFTHNSQLTTHKNKIQ